MATLPGCITTSHTAISRGQSATARGCLALRWPRLYRGGADAGQRPQFDQHIGRGVAVDDCLAPAQLRMQAVQSLALGVDPLDHRPQYVPLFVGLAFLSGVCRRREPALQAIVVA